MSLALTSSFDVSVRGFEVKVRLVFDFKVKRLFARRARCGCLADIRLWHGAAAVSLLMVPAPTRHSLTSCLTGTPTCRSARSLARQRQQRAFLPLHALRCHARASLRLAMRACQSRLRLLTSFMWQLLMQQAEPSLQSSMREEITKLVKDAEVAKEMLQVLQRSPASRLLPPIDAEAASAWLEPLVA